MVVKSWEEALATVQKDTSDSFYLFHINEGEEEKERTRFMNRVEAMAYCLYKMGRQRIGI